MAKKGCDCDLCGKVARMLCESDQASLCWDCDEKVHAANFLVAKHSRTLLCHLCQSPTPWKAAGPKLGHTISVCRDCAESQDSSSRVLREEEEEEDDDEILEDGRDSAESESDGGEYYSDSEEDYSDEEDAEEEEEEDGENQVVPWSESPESPSRSEEDLSLSSSSKRTRGDTSFESEDEEGCCSSHQDFEFKVGGQARRLKTRSGLSRPEEEAAHGGSLGTAAIVEKLRGFQQQGIVEEDRNRSASAVAVDLCKLARY